MFSVQAIVWQGNQGSILKHTHTEATHENKGGFSVAFSGSVLQERLRNRRTQALALSVREMS